MSSLSFLGAYIEVFERNKLLIFVTAATLGCGALVAAAVVLVSFASFPDLLKMIQSFIRSQGYAFNSQSYESAELFRFILANNTAHFWNPSRFAVWIPLVGAFLSGLELLVNAVVIGGAAALFSVLRGPVFTLVGLAPHGVFEIPAFLLQWAAVARWQLLSLRWLGGRIAGRRITQDMVWRDLKDVAVMALTALFLFVCAAYIEAYVTPGLLQAYSSG